MSSPYNRPETLNAIFAEIAAGDSLKTCLGRDGRPVMVTFWQWMRESPKDQLLYWAATQARTDALSEEILALADECTYETVAKVRLQIDTRKFLMAKMNPKRYGDKLELSSDPNAPVALVLKGSDREG